MVKSQQRKEKVKPESKKKEALPESFLHIGELGFKDSLSAVVPLLESPEFCVLIITSKRERILAIKSWIKKTHGFKVLTLTTGTSANTETENLKTQYQVLVSNPERLYYHFPLNHIDLSKFSCVIVENLETVIQNPKFLNLIASLNKNAMVKLQASNLTEEVSSFHNTQSSIPIVQGSKPENDIQTTSNYVIVEADKKFLLLYTFLFKKSSKKSVVIFNTSNEVIFFSELLKQLDLDNLASHSLKTSEKNLAVHEKFLKNTSGVLLSTSESLQGVKNIAQDFLLIFDFNEDSVLKECVGKAAGATATIIFFCVGEEESELRSNFPGCCLMKVPGNKIWNIQEKIEKIVKRNYEIHKKAREGYKNYILSSKLRDYHRIAKNFGLEKAFLVNNLS